MCERTLSSCTEHRIDNLSIDLCPKCERRLKNVLSGKDFTVALDMTKPISVCLGEASAASYNKYWAKYKDMRAKKGEWKTMDLIEFLVECTDAFRDQSGHVQKIANPFEIRMKFSNLDVVED
jgi:hypothetical protein